MKSILISILPEWVAKIFNGEKTAEIRRTAPKEWKDYLSGKTKIKPKPRTAYIYCTKGNAQLFKFSWKNDVWYDSFKSVKDIGADALHALEGDFRNTKIVAKFTLMEVEKVLSEAQDIYCGDYDEVFFTKTLIPDEFLNASQLSQEELTEYGGRYAYHISDLQIFDKPLGLGEFGLKRPPQSWRYIDI